MALLSIDNLSIFFKTSTGQGSKDLNVVNNLSLTVHRSEVFGIVGESGCGKTITACSIMGILPRNAYYTGDIRFEDNGLGAMTDEQMRTIRGKRMAMIFQEPMTCLNPVLTVGYQIAEVLITHKGLSKREAMYRAEELMSAVHIPSSSIRVKDYPHQMSGGMRQRVMIAMAIACDPALLIADEPTTALDVTIQAQTLALLYRIKEEKDMSIVLITHDLGIISEYANRIAVMYAGRIVEQAPVDDLFITPLHPYTIGLLNSLPGAKGVPLRPIPGVVPRPESLPKGCKFSDRCAFSIELCIKEEPQLTEVQPGRIVRCIRARENLWTMA